MDRETKQTSFQRTHKNGQQVHENILKPLIIRKIQIISKPQWDIIAYSLGWLSSKRQEKTCDGEDVKKMEPL